MTKVSVITLPFRKTYLIKPVYDAVFAQTHKDLEVIAVINDSNDGSKEIIRQNYPQVKIIEPGWNSWFAAGNNIGIKNSTGEFIQLVNDDLLLESDYIEKMLRAFEDPKVAAATGKLLRYDFANNAKTNVIDTTGIVINSSGRARDRGQLQEDTGQFDNQRAVFGVSGAGPMYRRAALEKVKYCETSPSQLPAANEGGNFSSRGGELKHSPPREGELEGVLYCEYFDEDFLAYWEDVDLSWRLNNGGFKNVYVPEAVAYHGRTAGQSKGGYLKIWNFVKHHKTLSPMVRQLNYKNHILMYIKNARFIFHPAFLIREIIMFGYILLFEISTLKVLPELFRQILRVLIKRKQSRRDC